MSDFSLETLNNGQILVGFQEVRPVWWGNQRLIDFAIAQGLLARSPLYDGAVPWDDAYALLNFAIVAFRCAAMVPTDDPQLFYKDGTPYEFAPIEYEGKRIIGRDDASAMFYVGSDGFNVADHQYADWALSTVQVLCGGGADLASIGLLGEGRICFSSICVPEWVETKSGFSIMPYINTSTGMDGTTASAVYAGAFEQVCDNTTRASRRAGEQSGRIAKVKHTKNSGLSITNARDAIGILENTASTMVAEIDALASYDVSDVEFGKLVDVLVPVPTETTMDGLTVTKDGRGATMASNKRDALWSLWKGNFSPVDTPDAEFLNGTTAPWKNTALGVQQAFSTYAQHLGIVRGTNRVERNMGNELAGKFADVDELSISTLVEVCDREMQYA